MPLAPIQALDYDGDGLTDLVLRTAQGVYCWRQHGRPGAMAFTFLMGCLIVAAGAAFLSVQPPGGARGGPKRSTDVE